MKTKLVIDDDSVYEIHMECKEERKEQEENRQERREERRRRK